MAERIIEGAAFAVFFLVWFVCEWRYEKRRRRFGVTPAIGSDEALIQRGCEIRSRTLNAYFGALARAAKCQCPHGEHNALNVDCVRATWERAGVMALQMQKDPEAGSRIDG
jgi:hypothetical protein